MILETNWRPNTSPPKFNIKHTASPGLGSSSVWSRLSSPCALGSRLHKRYCLRKRSWRTGLRAEPTALGDGTGRQTTVRRGRTALAVAVLARGRSERRGDAFLIVQKWNLRCLPLKENQWVPKEGWKLRCLPLQDISSPPRFIVHLIFFRPRLRKKTHIYQLWECGAFLTLRLLSFRWPAVFSHLCTSSFIKFVSILDELYDLAGRLDNTWVMSSPMECLGTIPLLVYPWRRKGSYQKFHRVGCSSMELGAVP